MNEKYPAIIRQLFTGTIDDALIFPYPSISEAEHERVNEFLAPIAKYLDENFDSERVDEEEQIPAEILDRLKELGLFGVGIPREYGGMGLSQSGYTRVFEFVSSYDTGLAIMFGVHLSIGIKGVILAGTQEQKDLYLPRAATGEWMASFALTEPLAGSDVASIRSRAEPQPDGRYLLNGEKIWIGNGSFSEIVVVFAQVPMEYEGGTRDRVTAFVLRPDMDGYERSEPLRKMGARGSNQSELRFRDIRVPADHVLGEVGGGFKLAMQVLNSGRSGLSGAAATGIKQCLSLAGEFAAEREQFGAPIANYELIQEKLARMAADAYTAESVAYFTAGLIDRGDVDYALEAAAAKVWSSEALDRAVDEAVQIAGGRGYVKGYPYERAYRDARITRIFEGTNEVMRLFIGFSGIEEPGERLQQIGAALREPIRELGTLADFAGERMRSALRRGEPSVEKQVDPRLEKHFDYLAEHTRDLRAATERAIRKHGRKIVDRQLVVARLADMAIELYVRSAMLSRTQAILEANAAGLKQTQPIPVPLPCDDDAVERTLRLCDLSAQLSGLRFRAARDATQDERDRLYTRISEDVVNHIV